MVPTAHRYLYLDALQASQTQHFKKGIHCPPILILPLLILHSMNNSSILMEIWQVSLPTRPEALGPILSPNLQILTQDLAYYSAH